MRQIVVTGSQGSVGKYLRGALLLRGCATIGVDRSGTDAEFAQDSSDRHFGAHALLDLRTGMAEERAWIRTGE